MPSALAFYHGKMYNRIYYESNKSILLPFKKKQKKLVYVLVISD